MRKLRITLTATAFFLAIGSVFAFTPSRPSSNTVVVKGMAATCPVSVVSNQCRLIVPGYICTFNVVLSTYMAVPEDSPVCKDAMALRIPQF